MPRCVKRPHWVETSHRLVSVSVTKLPQSIDKALTIAVYSPTTVTNGTPVWKPENSSMPTP